MNERTHIDGSEVAHNLIGGRISRCRKVRVLHFRVVEAQIDIVQQDACGVRLVDSLSLIHI